MGVEAGLRAGSCGVLGCRGCHSCCPQEWEVSHEYLKAEVSGGQAGWGRMWDPLPGTLTLHSAGPREADPPGRWGT